MINGFFFFKKKNILEFYCFVFRTTKRFGFFGSKSKNDSAYTVNYFNLVDTFSEQWNTFEFIWIKFFDFLILRFYNTQYRYASRWDLFVIFIGCVCTFLKSLTLPWVIIVYGEFTALMVERNSEKGTISPTILLKWFGGGRIL